MDAIIGAVSDSKEFCTLLASFKGMGGGRSNPIQHSFAKSNPTILKVFYIAM